MHRPVRQAANATLQIPCASQARDLGRGMAGSRVTGKFAGHSQEIPTLLAGERASETRPSSGQGQQKAGGEILPVADLSCLTGQYLRRVRPQPRVSGACAIPRSGTTISRIDPTGRPSKRSCERGVGGDG